MFNPNVEVVNVEKPYSRQYDRHPRECVVSLRIGCPQLVLLPPGRDPYTGISQGAVWESANMWKPNVDRRELVLRDALINGAKWETPSSALINAISKSPSKAKNMFARKRVGCKQAKRLEQLDTVGAAIDGDECIQCQALAARAMYLALDRPDVMFSAKEVCREFAQSTTESVIQLNRLTGHLVNYQRLVWRFDHEAPKQHLDVMSGTGIGGCVRTRRSTSGGVARTGTHIIKCYATTQSVVALSSAEAELTGLCQAAGESLGLQSICKDLGPELSLRLWSDSSAAIGICRRRGFGRVRHLAIAGLWLQDTLRSHDFELLKVAGHDNASDLLTKYVGRATYERHIKNRWLE